MAFTIQFKAVENNPDFPTKASPWRCNNCNKDCKVLLKIKVDYDTLILCKKCLTNMKKVIIEKEKDLNDKRKGCI